MRASGRRLRSVARRAGGENDDRNSDRRQDPALLGMAARRLRTRVMRDGAWVWRATTPNGMHADLQAHEVVEHDDGTITVSPSILTWQEHGEQWHGYLRRGVWSEV